MKRLKIHVVTALICLLATNVYAADTYIIDPVHSSAGFAVRHMMLSTVKGNFREFSGQILFDEQDIKKSSVNVVIKTASINTGNERRDGDLRSVNFFDAASYPEITFKSSRIEERGGALFCVGNLTMRGVTHEVAISFSYIGKVKDPMGNTRIGFEGSLNLNRQDYGISYGKTMDNGGLVVGNEVAISLTVEATKK